MIRLVQMASNLIGCIALSGLHWKLLKERRTRNRPRFFHFFSCYRSLYTHTLSQTSQLQPARGFDRLASLGFSEADIADIRLQFHSQTLSDFLDDQQFEGEDACKLDVLFVNSIQPSESLFLDIEHARSLEERWIESADGAASVSISQSRSSSLMQGILTGFFFPMLPLFFLAKLNPPVFWDNGEDFEPPENVVFSYVYLS
jgi:hypothetical protein